MSMPTGKKRDTTVVLLTLLFVVTGLVDATSILGLGRVFTANMTGNVVFLGFAIAGASGFHWVPYIAALLSFAFGVVMGGRLGRRYAPRGRRRWLIIAAVVEASLLWTAAACSLPAAWSSTAWVSYVLTGLTAAAMGSRNATVQQLNVPELTTTVVTRTITSLVVDSALAGGSGTNFTRRWHAVLALFVGAIAGAWLFLHLGVAVPLALAGLGTLAATLVLAEDQAPGAVIVSAAIP